MKKTIYTLCLLFAFTFAQAQNDIKARIEFEEAEKAFEAEDYKKSLSHLKKTEKLLGRWTSMVSYLKIEALLETTDMGSFDHPNMLPLFEEVKKYMSYMNKLSSSEIPLEKYKRAYEIEKIFNSYRFDDRLEPAFIKIEEEKDSDKIIKLATPLAEKGNSWAMRSIALAYLEKNEKSEAEKWLIQAFENGNNVVLKDLFKMNSDKDKVLAEKAAEQGGLLGFTVIAHYSLQEGNNKKAIEYLNKAIEMGSADSYIYMGSIYMRGIGVEVNLEKAEKYFLKAIDKESSNVYSILAALYFMKDLPLRAIEYLETGVEKNDSSSAVVLGYFYSTGVTDIEKNYEKAEKLFLKAISLDNPEADMYLAELYDQVDYRHPFKAIEHFERAKDAFPESNFSLGNIYYQGRGSEIPKDYEKAAKYYEAYFHNEERNKENDTYIDRLINIYNRGGYGVEKNKEKAKYWKNFKNQ